MKRKELSIIERMYEDVTCGFQKTRLVCVCDGYETGYVPSLAIVAPAPSLREAEKGLLDG